MKAIRKIPSLFSPRTLFGPIFWREMLVSGRKSFAHWARFTLVALLTFFVGFAVIGFQRSYGYGSISSQINELSDAALAVSQITIWVLFVLLPFVAAALGAGAITDERAARTFDSLLASPMSAWTIVASKLTSRTLQLLLLALLTLPVLLAVRTYGGYSAAAISLTTLVILAHGILAASLAVWFSLGAKNARSAFVGSIVMIVGYNLLPVFVLLAVNVLPSLKQFSDEVAMFVLHASPFTAVLITLNGVGDVVPSSFGGYQFLAYSFPLVSAGLMLLLSALLAWRTAARLRVATVGKKKAKIKSGTAPAQSPAGGKEGGGKGRSRTVRGNPVLWREVASAFSGTSVPVRILMVLAVIGLMALIYANSDLQYGSVHGVLYTIPFLLGVLAASASTAGTVAGEREARSLDLLLTTPITARGILFGKLANALFYPGILLVVPLAHTLIAKGAGLVHGEKFISLWLPLNLLMVAVPTYLLLGASGLLFGVLARKAMVATILNILLWAVIWVGVWIIPVMIDMFGPEPDFLIAVLSVINPVYWIAMAIDGGTFSWSNRLSYDLDGLPFDDMGPVRFTVLLGIWSAAASGVAAAFFLLAAKIFAGRTLRRR